MKIKILDSISLFFENNISEKQLSKINDYLLSCDVSVDSTKFLAFVFLLIFVLEILSVLIILLFDLDFILLLVPLILVLVIFLVLLIKKERRISEIERTAPDFLRQLSSMLQVGLSFENAMEDMSSFGSGPLYDEMKRTIIEIKMGKNFDQSWIDMSKRLKSREIERIFIIILDGRKSGASISNVIMEISNDLRDVLALKRERKSSVMMAIMFLIISAVIASPFALGMVSIYGEFMESFGKTSEIVQIAPLAGEIYLVIHSFLVGLIISVIMYGNFKKGIKFSIPLVFASFLIFNFMSMFGGRFLIGGI